MTERTAISHSDDGPLMLSDAERKAIERMRMTPEQRRAEVAAQDQAAMASLPVEVRQAYEGRAKRMATMTQEQRRAYQLGLHFVAMVQTIHQETKRGVKLADVLGSQDAAEAEILTWFLEEDKVPKADVLIHGGGKGGV
jgi:hypothetical protein